MPLLYWVAIWRIITLHTEQQHLSAKHFASIVTLSNARMTQSVHVYWKWLFPLSGGLDVQVQAGGSDWWLVDAVGSV